MSGTLDPSAIDRIVRAAKVLAEDMNTRVMMATRMQSLIDGRGAERLAHKLLSQVSKNLKPL